MPSHIPGYRIGSFKKKQRTSSSGVKTLSYKAPPIAIASSRQASSTLATHGVNPIFSEDPKIYSPTFREIQENKYRQNFMGAKFESRDNSEDGIEFVHYEDGSVLITNEDRGEYHFFTAAGQKHKAHLLGVTGKLFDTPDLLEKKPKLGEGKFSQVHQLKLPAQEGIVAVKTTSSDLFRARENTEMMGLMQLKEKGENPRSSGGQVWIHRTALKDTAKMIGVLGDLEVAQPEFYGFSLRENADSQGIQEIQYHEVIDNASSMLQLLKRIENDRRGETKFNLEGLLNQATLEEVLESSCKGDVKRFTSNLVTQYHEFCDEVAKRTQAHPRVNGEIGDIAFYDDGGPSNVLVTGYDTQTNRFQFTIIDPTETQSFLPNRALSKADGHRINNQIDTGDQRSLIDNELHQLRPLTFNNSDWEKTLSFIPLLNSKASKLLKQL